MKVDLSPFHSKSSREATIMKAFLSTEKNPSTHEWVQLMGHGWHMPSASGYFQMGM